MRVSPRTGYRLWSATYDTESNPILALDARVLGERLGVLHGLRIMDVACGAGRWMIEAQRQGASVIGVDFSPEMLDVAARKPGISGHVVMGDAVQLPFRDGIADMALCSMAISYFPSIEDGLAEMARVVRCGGRVVVSDLHPDAAAAGWKRSFRSSGSSYEIDHYVVDLEKLSVAAERMSLTPDWRIDACFDNPERPIFERAGKQDQFAELRRIPALHAACWTKL